MPTSPQLQELIQKEVSRKEFLMLSGLAVGSIFGFGTLIRLLTGKSLKTNRSLLGYGDSNYGNKSGSAK